MKFIRNWLKKIIHESIVENFPPINITVIENDESQHTLKLENGIFNNSKIIMRKNKNVSIEKSLINAPVDGTFITME